MKGKHTYRFGSNPLEQQFAEEWERQEKHTLGYVLSDEPNNPTHVDDHDREIVATMMQWLGSPVGQAFLENALGFNVRDQIPEHLRAR